MTSSPLAGENAPDKGKMSLFEGVDVNVQVEVELMGASSGSTRKIEEQIEKLQHKLKIYERKKKLEKAKVATARIEALKRALQGEEVDLSALENAAAPDTDVSESEDDAPNTGAATTKNRYQFDRLTVLATEGILLPVMNAGEAITITFGLLCRRNTEETLPAVQTNTINLLLFEAKDQEVNRIVPIDITVVRPEGETGTPSNNLVAHSRRSAPPPCLQLLPDDQAQGPTSFFMGSPLVVLRNSIVDDHTEFRFFVKSSLSTTVVVLEPRRLGCSTAYALEARFKFFPRNGLVKKDETLPIVVECTPAVLDRKSTPFP
ncbi:hypothetical protein AGDE_14571 [Angomonas deanei]|uniref:Uncharacterized protein n=1 Tax=Angomonas deanei TaxID=59799 RepID=A0A7G2BZE0_9TRYP|nr:hypothetical protein AGDE_14571 [Angomonas deanei]CAD2212810.1 hypothetical protein, conserved [Angomonas deanei]|eukprot:EPY20623.1 hypothetical protein AGDE_14571 [Angomonas deanei]